MTLSKGFTLLEILVALVILAIAFISAFSTVSSHIRNLIYLQNKLVAEWTAQNVIEEIKLGSLIQNHADASGTRTSLNKSLVWKSHFSPTENKQIFKLEVAVG